MKKLPNGTLLHNRYKILKPLGEGAFGVVYMVDDTINRGVRKAVKEFAHEAIPRGKEELISRETRFLAGLSHPGLPRVLDQFFDNQNFYMVMDYFEGDTLDAEFILMGTPFTQEEVIPWMIQLCDILDYLHSQDPPVIYRDLKPSNIIINSDREVRLIDFGTARLFNPVKMKDTFIMGTPGFAAPEQYGTGQSDARSDIYAYGATFYFLLTRMNMETARFVFPPARSLNPLISEEMEGFLAQCMDIDPNQRFSSVREVKSEIMRLFVGPPEIAPPEAEETSKEPSHREYIHHRDASWLIYVLCASIIIFLQSLFNSTPVMNKILMIAMICTLSVNLLMSLLFWRGHKATGSVIVPLVFWGSIFIGVAYAIRQYLLLITH